MKLLMVTPLLPHPNAMNGGELVKYEQLRLLTRRHEVTLLSFVRAEDPTEDEAVARIRALGARLETIPRPLATSVHGFARRAALATRWATSGAPLRALAFADRRMQDRLTRLMAVGRFELLQVWDNAMGAYAFPDAPATVLTEQEVITDAVRARGLRGALEGGRWRRHQRAVWRRFDHVEVFTARDATAVRALAPDLHDRVSVNPFGIDPIDTDISTSRAAEEPDTVAFVGGFLHAPNVDAVEWLATEIMPALWACRPALRLEIVGSYPPHRVRALASERVVVTGRVPRVEPFLERAAVVLAPVRTGGGMRVKVLQAMTMGKAVVTTPLGAEGLASWDHDVPPCAIAADAAAFTAATAALLDDAAGRHALGERARAFVAAHHSWDAYGRRLDAIHERVLREHAARQGA